MNFEAESFQTTITDVHGCLVANIQTDLTEEALAELRENLLGRIERSQARGVVLDFSGLAVMDQAEFVAVRKLVHMVELLGPPCVVAGLNAGIVSYLVTTGADTTGLRSVLGLDEALKWLTTRWKKP